MDTGSQADHTWQDPFVGQGALYICSYYGFEQPPACSGGAGSDPGVRLGISDALKTVRVLASQVRPILPKPSLSNGQMSPARSLKTRLTPTAGNPQQQPSPPLHEPQRQSWVNMSMSLNVLVIWREGLAALVNQANNQVA